MSEITPGHYYEKWALELGYQRLIGQAGLRLAEDLNEGATREHPRRVEDVASTLGCIAHVHLAIEEGRRRIGDDLAGNSLPGDIFQVEEAIAKLYGNIPLTKDELAIDPDVIEPLMAGRLPEELRDKAERIFGWSWRSERIPLDSSHGTMYLPLDDGPRQVRDAGLVLFYQMADDSKIPDDPYWPPPEADAPQGV